MVVGGGAVSQPGDGDDGAAPPAADEPITLLRHFPPSPPGSECYQLPFMLGQTRSAGPGGAGGGGGGTPEELAAKHAGTHGDIHRPSEPRRTKAAE